MQKNYLSFGSTILFLMLSVAITVAQGACAAFLGHALEAVDVSCQGLGRNQACYGYNRVEASFQTDVTDDVFSEPSDVTEVFEIETIRTAPLNLDSDEWGVAVMVLQANMPETLPGQNVTFVLMGDTEIENAVMAEDAHIPIAGIDVTVTYPQGAAIRSGPGDNFNTIGGVVVGTIFTTDGISANGNWLRIVWNERPAWIRRTTVEATPEIEALPVFNEDLRTPMQAFFLRTGIGQPECEEVPDNSVLVQGPEDIQIDLSVNGANISLGSSGILRILNPESEQPLLEITVLDGEFVIHADEFNAQDTVIRAGQRTTLCLDDDNNEGVNGKADDLLVSCAASPPERVDISQFQEDWCSLESIPANLLHYPLSTCSNNSHTVQAGENLFRIALYYCVALDELIAINGIGNSGQVFVGQELILPAGACEGSGSTRPPAGVIDPGTSAENPVAQVCTVNLLSPLADVDSGNHTFSWSAVPIADVIYHLVFFNFQGMKVESFRTSETAYNLNLGQQTSTGGEFSWSVEVTDSNGVFLCAAGRSPTLVRLGTLNPPDNSDDNNVVSVSLSMNITCVTAGATTATLNWNNLPGGQSITYTITQGAATLATRVLTGPNGSDGFTGAGPFTATAVSTTGASITRVC